MTTRRTKALEVVDLAEYALFCVALTRARREVLINSHGKPSAWLTARRAKAQH